MQCSTTVLLQWRNHFTAIDGENADRGFVDVAKYLVHDATTDEADTIACVADGRRYFGQESQRDVTSGIIHQRFGCNELSFEGCGQVVYGVK